MHEKLWHQLTRREQDLYLTLLWKDDHSEQAIADFFGTTKGPIVVRRQRVLQLPTGKRKATNVKRKVDPERFRDLLHLYEMEQIEKNGIPAIAPPSGGRPEDNTVTPEVLKPVQRCRWPLSTPRKGERRSTCNEPVDGESNLCRAHKAIALGRPLPSNDE